MTINILTFGVRAVDANLLQNGNQQLNGNVGPNELTAANLINSNGIPFQQLLLFMGQANDGDLNIDAGETAFNLSDMGAKDAVISLAVANTNDALRIRAHGLATNTALGDLSAAVRFDNTIGFGLDNAPDDETMAHWLNAGDSLTFQLTQINGLSQFMAAASFVVHVNGGGSENVVIDFDGDVVKQIGPGQIAADGINLGAVADGTTVALDFASRSIRIGATSRAMTDSEYLIYLAGGLNQLTIGALNTSTQGFAIGDLAIASIEKTISGEAIHAPPGGGLTTGTANDDIIVGAAVADTINAGAGDDVIYAGGGSDTVSGGDGNDIIEGGEGDDILIGGAGNDIIVGGSGSDTMTGGAGADAFVFRSLSDMTSTTDEITDFEVGVDIVTLSVIDGLSFIGQAAFSGGGAVGQVRFQVVGGTTEIQVDVNGDGLYDGADKHLLITNGQFNLTETSPGSLVLEAKPITGTASNDTLNGFDAFDDLILGLGGDDVLNGGDRNDRLEGGDGGDTLRGGAGNDVLIGGDGGDLIYGGTGDDLMDGGDSEVDWLSYNLVGPGFLPSGVVVDLALTGPQAVGGGHGTDTISGFEFLEGSAFGDFLYGDDGDNLFAGVGGDDYINGRGGNDTADYNGSTGAATVSLSDLGPQNTGGAGWDTLVNIENLQGSSGNDFLTGNAGDNVLAGALGNDTLNGMDGDDVLNGGLGDDDMDGGDGVDTVDYSRPTFEPRTEGVGVDLAAGRGGTISGGEQDTLTGIENVVGTEFDDDILGSALNNEISGFEGADIINGNAGDDTIFGGGGDDTLNGGDGVDTIFGGPGNDFIILQRNNNPNLGFGEFAFGGGGDDTFRSSSGGDLLNGGGGFDRVTYFNITGAPVYVDLNSQGTPQDTGGGGMDTLVSIENVSGTGSFGDVLIGDNGANALAGNGGADTLTGNGGADTFIFQSAGGDIDLITDFSVADDTILIDSEVFPLTPGVLDPGAFHIGSVAADANDRVIYDSVTGQLWYDADGDGAGAAIQFATLSTGLTLTSADFIIV